LERKNCLSKDKKDTIMDEKDNKNTKGFQALFKLL
jgi:hypothetical protein